MKPFAEALKERVLVCDGAMGTMLYSRGVFINKSFDAMNLTQADLVESVHDEYVRAGPDVLVVHALDEIRLGQVHRVEALVDEHAARIKHRAHRSVAHQDAFSQGVREFSHLVIWSSSH